MRALIVLLFLIAPVSAQVRPVSPVEQSLQQRLGNCIGDHDRVAVALQEAQRKIAELEARLKKPEAK